MKIQDYYQLDGEQLQFTETQASQFAKSIAGDFNPLHDVGGKRFCVPGDLLFSVLLNRYGVFSSMQMKFEGMLSADVPVLLPETIETNLTLKDATGKAYLEVTSSGDRVTDPQAIATLTQEYVQFSGKTFPDILVELMRKEGVMINPTRPLVIYTDMALELSTTELLAPKLKLADTSLIVEGKKGKATLRFDLHDNGELVGRGEKNMVLGSLREFDEETMGSIVEQYQQWQQEYRGVGA
ncbi:MAG: DUF3581 family protein [Granulosicoccaceae bacterium]